VLDHEERAFEVDFVGFVPGLFISIDHVSEIGAGRSVVDKDIETAIALIDFCKQLVYLGQIAGMAGKHIRPPAFLFNFFFYLLESLDFAADKDTAGTVFCQCHCDGFSDSPAGAGYQRYFIIQRKIWASFIRGIFFISLDECGYKCGQVFDDADICHLKNCGGRIFVNGDDKF